MTRRFPPVFGGAKTPAAKEALASRVRALAGKPAPTDVALAKPRTKAERAERRALFRHGVLILESGQRLSVAIKNLSETGARVEFGTREILSDEVVLAEPTLRLRKRARVVWQGDSSAGLAFLEE